MITTCARVLTRSLALRSFARSLVRQDIGKPLGADGKQVVKEEIDIFLMDRASQPHDGGSGETSGNPSQVKSRVGSKRLDTPGAGGSAQKKRRASGAATDGAGAPDGAGVEVVLSDVLPGNYQIGNRRFAGLSRFAGKLLVNIREYYDKGDGKLLPGNKGISLTCAQFEELNKKADRVDVALGQDPFSEVQFKISENRFCTVREYGGRYLVDLREYYMDREGGEWKPGKKGISLTAAEQWVKLRAAMPALLAQGGGTATAVAATSTVSPQGNDNTTTTTNNNNDDNPPALPWGNSNAVVRVSESKYRLGTSKKFVSLENWKGQDVLDIREFYEDGVEWKPGRKGLSLSVAQTQSILGALDAITTALNAQDVSYALDLSNKRRVTISNFNNSFMVNIREYFEKDGQLLPTKKGISLMPQQWLAARDAIAELSSRMTTQ